MWEVVAWAPSRLGTSVPEAWALGKSNTGKARQTAVLD